MLWLCRLLAGKFDENTFALALVQYFAQENW